MPAAAAANDRLATPLVRGALVAALLVALCGPAAAGAAEPPLRPANASAPLGEERLSDERTLTRWAHAVARDVLRAQPSTAGKPVGRLRWSTEEGLPEVYLTLASRLDRRGRVWIKVRVPGRPNGRVAWVRERALTDLHVVETHLTIDVAGLTATLRKRGKPVWRSPVGVGKSGTATPTGRFWVRTRLRNLAGDPLYGPWAFGTSAYSALTDWPGGGVVGIHGTDQPELIPGRPSHGCVRVPNSKVRRLARLMPIGTPITIR